MCSVLTTNTLRDCVSLNMFILNMKESAFAEDVEYLPSDGLHRVYNFSIAEIEIVCAF